MFLATVPFLCQYIGNGGDGGSCGSLTGESNPFYKMQM